jgi:hypothetical protein
MCSTIGVPTEYACPMLLSQLELVRFNRIFATCDTLSVAGADKIALLVKSYRTNEVYNTRGGISESGELVTLGPAWKITRAYNKQLRKIAKRYKSTLEICTGIDQSFRIKRARGGPVNVHDERCNKTRVVVWYQTTSPIMGDLAGSWFDVTLTDAATDQEFCEHPDKSNDRKMRMKHITTELVQANRLVRNCGHCGVPDLSECPHRKCGKCGLIAYCGINCQKIHWKREHKLVCGSSNDAM